MKRMVEGCLTLSDVKHVCNSCINFSVAWCIIDIFLHSVDSVITYLISMESFNYDKIII